jgi:hypothetical protein
MFWRYLGGAPGHRSDPLPLRLFEYSEPVRAQATGTSPQPQQDAEQAEASGEPDVEEATEGVEEDAAEDEFDDGGSEASSGSDDDDGEL